jgi:hypothetical protein
MSKNNTFLYLKFSVLSRFYGIIFIRCLFFTVLTSPKIRLQAGKLKSWATRSVLRKQLPHIAHRDI